MLFHAFANITLILTPTASQNIRAFGVDIIDAVY